MDGSQTALWPLIGVPLLIFFARAVDVTLGTMRIALVSRGQRALAPLLGFFEILVWLLALGQVVQNLDRPANYIAYAAGFAGGTWVGLLLDEKLALGLLSVRVITRDDARGLIEDLRRQQFGVTHVAAKGLSGRVRLLFSVIRRADLRRLLDTVRAQHPRAFISVSDVRLAREGYLPPGSFNYPRLLELLRKK